jgi:hypothetical protein
MLKHHSAQRYLLVQLLAWFNIWRRYGMQGKNILESTLRKHYIDQLFSISCLP